MSNPKEIEFSLEFRLDVVVRHLNIMLNSMPPFTNRVQETKSDDIGILTYYIHNQSIEGELVCKLDENPIINQKVHQIYLKRENGAQSINFEFKVAPLSDD